MKNIMLNENFESDTGVHTHTRNVNINIDEITRGFYALAYLNKTKKIYIKPVVI